METFLGILLNVIIFYFLIKYFLKRHRKRKMINNGKKHIHPDYPDLNIKERFDIHVNGISNYMKEYIPIAGEGVVLKREPDNQYDMDAIAVLNLLGKKIGYIPAKYNSDLASEMDGGKKLAGQVRKAIPRGKDDMEVVIKIVEPIIK